MSARPFVSVQGMDGDASVEQVSLPDVFTTPVRPDLVRIVHTGMAKNKRQAYAVHPKAGHQTSAESWGTGRAVSRIPRVGGGGTSRSGQAAFGNMCRGGRMFAPLKQWRRWHRKVNVKMKRAAVASCLAASAVPALVMARGHKIDNCEEIPLVVSDAFESVSKTSTAKSVMIKLGAGGDLERASSSKKIRPGKGKMRNRRYVMAKGPLIVHAGSGRSGSGIEKAARNIPGAELCHVERLNLLMLAPGGHVGRFIIWTKGAFEKLDVLYGSGSVDGTRKAIQLPRPMMSNADLGRIINSDEIQTVVRPSIAGTAPAPLRRNPLKNRAALMKLNPFLVEDRDKVTKASKENSVKRQARLKEKRSTKTEKEVGKEFYKSMTVDSDYSHQWNEPFRAWLEQEK